jgi:2-polyprenyl-3-methyl-5-hydroxy-6-metoxy-1,4-benzoquinol methylase
MTKKIHEIIQDTLLSIDPEIKTAFNGYFYRNPICEGWALTRKMFPLPVSDDASILDIGCGHGGLLFYMWHAGFRNLSGSDCSARKIEWARELHARHDMDTTWHNCDLLEGIAGKFDAITAIGFLYEARNRLGLFFDQASRRINTNGVVVFNWPVWERSGRGNRPYFAESEVIRMALSHGFASIKTDWSLCKQHRTALFTFRFNGGTE